MIKDSKNNNKSEQNLTAQTKELVIARINAQVPSNLRLSVGSSGSLTKEEMIKQVREGSEVGKAIIESHLRFLRAQIAGKVTRALTSVE